MYYLAELAELEHRPYHYLEKAVQGVSLSVRTYGGILRPRGIPQRVSPG